MLNIDEKQWDRLRTTFRRAFYASACVTALSASFALYTNHQMRDGGPWDLHSDIDDKKIELVMENNPGYSKDRARYELEKQADEFESQTNRFGRNNTLALFAMTLLFYALQRKPQNRQDNDKGPRP